MLNFSSLSILFYFICFALSLWVILRSNNQIHSSKNSFYNLRFFSEVGVWVSVSRLLVSYSKNWNKGLHRLQSNRKTLFKVKQSDRSARECTVESDSKTATWMRVECPRTLVRVGLLLMGFKRSLVWFDKECVLIFCVLIDSLGLHKSFLTHALSHDVFESNHMST